MAKFAASVLSECGYDVAAVSYWAYSKEPSASVPMWALPFRRPRMHSYRDNDGLEISEIGAWLPELEFLHEYPTRHWRELADGAQAHIAVAGTPLGGLALSRLGVRHFLWTATPWQDDRAGRSAQIPLARRLFDSVANVPVCRFLEQKIVREGRTVALSDHTRDRLNTIAGGPFVKDVIRVPPESQMFWAGEGRTVRGRVGFVGRLEDSRKNIALLVEALSICRRDGVNATAYLVGGTLRPEDRALLEIHGMVGAVTVLPYVERSRLRELLETCEAYVLPSKQEGLCIAALEAMACGIPVISTRCGGPEEFVVDGVNGFLVGHSAQEMAEKLSVVLSNASLRRRLSSGAEETIRTNYSRTRCTADFLKAFHSQVGGG